MFNRSSTPILRLDWIRLGVSANIYHDQFQFYQLGISYYTIGEEIGFDGILSYGLCVSGSPELEHRDPFPDRSKRATADLACSWESLDPLQTTYESETSRRSRNSIAV